MRFTKAAFAIYFGMAFLLITASGAVAPDNSANTLNTNCPPVSPTQPPPKCCSTHISLSCILRGSTVTCSGGVTICDSHGATLPGASVCGTWKVPNTHGGFDTSTQTFTTNNSGICQFSAAGARGQYTLTVTSVSKSGYDFDAAHSTLTASITK